MAKQAQTLTWYRCDTDSSPNTNDLYIHYMDKSTGTPSLEEKKSNCANKDENIIHVLKLYFRLCCNSFEVYVFVAHLKSHQRCSAVFLQTSQVLPHWLNHHFSLILVLYTHIVMLE